MLFYFLIILQSNTAPTLPKSINRINKAIQHAGGAIIILIYSVPIDIHIKGHYPTGNHVRQKSQYQSEDSGLHCLAGCIEAHLHRLQLAVQCFKEHRHFRRTVCQLLSRPYPR